MSDHFAMAPRVEALQWKLVALLGENVFSENPLDTLNDFIEFYSRYRFR